MEKGARTSPGVLVVEAQSNLIDTGWVRHDEAEARLGREERSAPPGRPPGLPAPSCPAPQALASAIAFWSLTALKLGKFFIANHSLFCGCQSLAPLFK